MKLRLSIAVAMLCAISHAQVPVSPILVPHQTFVDASGSPCAGCSLYSYTAGTTSQLATFTDSTGVSQNTNPIVLSVQGGANIWVNESLSYKFVLKSTLGATIWTVDNVESPGNTAGLIVQAPIGTQTVTQPSGTNFNVSTSGGGKLRYNGSEVITQASIAGTAVLQAPTTGQTVNQPIVASVQTDLSVNSLNGVLNASIFPGSDLGAKVAAAIAALGGACGTVNIPVGTYTWSSDSILIAPCQTLIGNGAIVNVTVSNGKPFLIAAALPDFNTSTNTATYTQGGIRDITFVGPGAGTVGSPNTSTGIWIGGDSLGALTPANYVAFLMVMYNVHVRSFGCGVKYGIGYQISWMAGSLEENYDNVCFQDNTTGLENLNFHGTQILNAIHMGINQPFTDKFVEINLYGCSLDYNGQNDPNGALINLAFATLNIFGGHYENRRLPFFRLGSGSAGVHASIGSASFNMITAGTFAGFIRVDGTNNYVMMGGGNQFAGSATTTVTNLFDWNAAGANNQAYVQPYLNTQGPNSHDLPTFGGSTTPQFFINPAFDLAGDVTSIQTSASINAANIGLTGTVRASGASVPGTQGGYLGWNRNADGFTDFVNNPGSGGGGWNWWSSNPAGTSLTKVASMDGTGTFIPRVIAPIAASTAPGGACTVAGTLQITADGHATYCQVGTLVWTTLY